MVVDATSELIDHYIKNIAVVNASIATNIVTIIGIMTKDMITPAMASPRGRPNRPMNENTEPRIHISHPNRGIQPIKMLINDKTNPAMAIWFEGFWPS